jgi:ABC-type maltose transport system permease subunit
MSQAVADAHLKRRMLAAGAIVGLLIPVIWFGFFYLGTGILVPHIFNMEGIDYIIFAIWPSFFLLLVWNQSALVVGAISVLLNVILYTAYGYALAALRSRLRG